MNQELNIKPRILVVLEPHAEAERLLRAAKRKAKKEDIDWEVILVESPRSNKEHSEEDKELLQNMCALAIQMGGLVSRVHAKNLFVGVLKAAANRKIHNIPIYSIKLGDVKSGRGFIFTYKSLAERLEEALNDEIRVSTIPLGIYIPATAKIARQLKITGRQLLFCFVVVGYAILALEATASLYPELFGANRNKTLVFLIACMLAAWRGGFLAGLISGTLGFLTLGLLYYSPNHDLRIDNPTFIFNLALYTIGVLLISILGNKDFDYKLMLARRAERFHALLSVHRLALNKDTAEETIEVIDSELRKLLRTEIVFFIPSVSNENELEVIFSRNVRLGNSEKHALAVCWDEIKTTGVGAPFNPEGCKWRFEPMVTAKDEVGVLAILVNDYIDLDDSFARLMQGIADQVALILERLDLEHIAEDNKVKAEREKLRSMLLSSVSHDLKTPLASVIGSLSVFRSMEGKLSGEQKSTLINTALDEAQRLDNFISNILEMTRIESGKIELRQEWVDPEPLIIEVTKRLKDRLRGHGIRFIKPAQGIEVYIDVMMTGQVIQNLLDNAAKYTKAGTDIEVEWAMVNNQFELIIRDFGAGIAENQLEKIFDKYTRISKQDSQVAGTGLGLAISRAVIHTQGGSITASNHEKGGAAFTIKFPLVRTTNKKEVA